MAVAFIPHWSQYLSGKEDLCNRELWELSSKTLLEYSLELIESVPSIETTFLFSDDSSLSGFVPAFKKLQVLNRPQRLNHHKVSIEEVTRGFIETIDLKNETIVLMHPKSPFLKSDSVGACIQSVLSGDFHSSSFGVKYYKPGWFDNNRINTDDILDTAHPQYIKPIIIENSSTYVFNSEVFMKNNSRISNQHKFHFLSYMENFEVEKKSQLALAELFINAGLNKLEAKYEF